MKRLTLCAAMVLAFGWGESPASAEQCLAQSTPPTYTAGMAVPQVCDTHGTQKVMTVDEDGNYVAGGGGGGAGDASLAEQQTQTGHLSGIETAAEALDSSVPAAAALADGTSNPTTTGFAAYNMCFNGTTWDRCTGTSTLHYATSAASNNATNVKNAAGTVSTISVVNTTATIYYLRMYNLASAPTCSSATGFVNTIPVPASTSGAGIVIPITVPHSFTTGIGYCLTGGGSSTDNTNAATGVYINIWYK